MCRRFIRQIAHKFRWHTDVCQEILGNMTDEDAVQMSGERFLEVPYSITEASKIFVLFQNCYCISLKCAV